MKNDFNTSEDRNNSFSLPKFEYSTYTIEGLDGISECKTFEEVVEYKMPDFRKIDKLNQPLEFRRAV